MTALPRTMRFQSRALGAANEHGGTVWIPEGKTCLMKATHNLGNVNGTGRPAAGITLRGASMVGAAPSTILFSPTLASDIPECSGATGGGFSTGNASSPTAQYVTFEDIALVGGPRFSSCLLNATAARSETSCTSRFDVHTLWARAGVCNRRLSRRRELHPRGLLLVL